MAYKWFKDMHMYSLIQSKIHLLNDYHVLGAMLGFKNAKITKKWSQYLRPHNVKVGRQTHTQMI